MMSNIEDASVDDAIDDEYNSEAEKEHFFKIVHAFKSYRVSSQAVVFRRLSYLSTLPIVQQNALSTYRATLEIVLKCVDANQKVIQLIVEDVEKLFENVQHTQNPLESPTTVSTSDIDKVQVTLKQIYRDWSADGVIERIQAYNPIIEELEKRFPVQSARKREDIDVLVPGAGLGRLAFEIAKLGFTCQGNEFSLFMLFTSNFILNRCPGIDLHKIYPWAHSCDNNLSAQEMFKAVSFPDIDPSILCKINAEKTRFTMVAGDFLDVYQKEEEWDCVATCFFIDCASNIYTFIERIHRILKKGGVWINLGPLQYHFSTSVEENSIEPSFDDIRLIIKSFGFSMENEVIKHPTSYCQNRNSMLKQYYDSVFFTCVKP